MVVITVLGRSGIVSINRKYGGIDLKKDILKPKPLSGFMELLPEDQIVFNNMLDTIRSTYESFGFLPLDTPVIEREEVLLAKAGGETEKQIYKFTKGDTDLALRFDLTVPLSRYVAMNFHDLNFPFRRYHIGKVYRGERSQRGRFREFYQCDIDIIGNGKLDVLNDAEILSVIYNTFRNLGFEDFTVSINNRRLLNGLFAHLEIEDSAAVLRVIDKIEKIGEDKVREELLDLGLDQDKANAVLSFMSIGGDNLEKIEKLKALDIPNETFLQGLEEIEKVVEYVSVFGVPEDNYKIDLTIARGLDYYTGTVYETFLDNYKELGSICSGGRYDNLAENYINQKLPGVGISIGLTRLFDQLKAEGLLEEEVNYLTKAMIIPIGDEAMKQSVELSEKLREEGINNQIYYEKAKMGKKFGFADKLDIPYVIIIGSEEIEENKYTLRNMSSGDQETLDFEEIIKIIK